MSELKIESILVKVVRADRRTISIQIKADGIYVRAPFRMSDAEIECFLDSKSDWIRKHLRMVADRNAEAKNLHPYTYEEIRDLAAKALQAIPERVKYYAAVIGVDYGNITIRNQRTRWGSCSMDPDNRTDFHRQPRLFLSLRDAFYYIKRHDEGLALTWKETAYVPKEAII